MAGAGPPTWLPALAINNTDSATITRAEQAISRRAALQHQPEQRDLRARMTRDRTCTLFFASTSVLIIHLSHFIDTNIIQTESFLV